MKTPTIPGLTPFDFAGFRWPRYVAMMACGPEALRKKQRSRQYVGEYYHAPRPIKGHTEHGFYLDSDGQPFGRWKWADDCANLKHTGWFCDEYGDQTIRGLVACLPHGKYLAGWSMGEGMASCVEAYTYDTELDAALAADSMAEHAAERQQDYQAQHPID